MFICVSHYDKVFSSKDSCLLGWRWLAICVVSSVWFSLGLKSDRGKMWLEYVEILVDYDINPCTQLLGKIISSISLFHYLFYNYWLKFHKIYYALNA